MTQATHAPQGDFWGSEPRAPHMPDPPFTSHCSHGLGNRTVWRGLSAPRASGSQRSGDMGNYTVLTCEIVSPWQVDNFSIFLYISSKRFGVSLFLVLNETVLPGV